jgi:hypothetical protein
LRDAYTSKWPSPGEIKHLRYPEQVKILFGLMQVRFPSAELPDETIEAYRGDWHDLLRECGTQRFLTGLQHACKSTSFFPTLADVARHIPQPTASGYSGWSHEDRARKAAGERSYGKLDVEFLWKLHRAAREKRNGAHLSERDLDDLVVDLDRAIDRVEQVKAEAAGGR